MYTTLLLQVEMSFLALELVTSRLQGNHTNARVDKEDIADNLQGVQELTPDDPRKDSVITS